MNRIKIDDMKDRRNKQKESFKKIKKERKKQRANTEYPNGAMSEGQRPRFTRGSRLHVGRGGRWEKVRIGDPEVSRRWAADNSLGWTET